MIPRRCRRCGTPIWVWPWQRPLCRARELQDCLDREVGNYGGYGPEEPDPIWSEQPPSDVGVCSACRGTGITYRNDWEMGPQPEDCGRCEGSKMDPSWA